MFIDWTDAYKLGIPQVDNDHKKLVDLLNRFFACSQDSGDTASLGAILNDLVNETRNHFQREEVMLDRHNYPYLAPHAAEHERLILQLGHFQTPYLEGKCDHQVTVETAEFLRNWLLNHIQHEDMAYRSYVKKLS